MLRPVYLHQAHFTYAICAIANWRAGLVVVLALVSLVLPLAASSGLMPTGDEALHTDLASQIASSWSLATQPASHYPPFYHVLGSVFYAIGDVEGLRVLSALSFAVISATSYLLSRQLGLNHLQSLAAQALVSLSPVLLWYTGHILVEPMLVATVMVSLALALRFEDKPDLKRGAALVLALTAMLLVKQTSAPVAIGIVVYILIMQVGWKKTAAVAGVTALLIAFPYQLINSGTGAFIDLGQPSITDARNIADSFPGSVIASGWVDHQPGWSVELEQDVDGPALRERGTAPHEQRHVWLGNIFSWSKFTWLHSLFPADFSGYDLGQLWPSTLLASVGLLLGMIAVPYTVRQNPRWLLLAIVLGTSYVVMYFGSDTKRLFLYVTVMSAPLVILGYGTAWSWTMSKWPGLRRLSAHAGPLGAGVAVLVVLAALPQLNAQFRSLGDRELTQGGGFSSSGGIEAVSETGKWLEANLEADEGFVAGSVYEWEYYANRQDLWDEGLDYRLYFLPPELIHEFLAKAGARFVVIRLNQLQPDDSWNHIELVPERFATAVDDMFPLVFESTAQDIRVYEVAPY